MKKFLIIVGMFILLTVPLTFVSAGELAANPSQGIGNPINECQNATGIIFDHGIKFEGSALSEGNTIAPVTISNFGFDSSNDLTSLDWRSGTTGISVVLVKAGSGDAIKYDYISNPVTSGSVSSEDHGISHVTFCWNDPVDPASVSVSVGACVFSGQTTDVILTITGASVTITSPDGTWGPYTNSQTIQLPAGSYSYTYTALDGYTGSGSGSFSVNECPYATVTVNPLACEWDPDNEVSATDVELTVENASLTLTGPAGVVGTYTSSTTVENLEPGEYTYTWTGLTGYQGSGSGSFTLIECNPTKAEADVSAGACVWDEENGSLTEVTITVSNASLTINGNTYTESTSIKLGPGSYPFTWEATGDAEGSGSGTLVVEDCSPKEQAEAEITIGACNWNGEESLTEVAFTLSGTSLTFTSSSGQDYGPYTESDSVALPAGEYTYSWTAVEGFSGSGEGTFTLISCEPGVASASVLLGACGFIDGTSLTPVTINVNHALLTINGVTYTEGVTIELEPGEYEYTWEANEEGYAGEGSGTLIVDSCEPKEEEEKEEKPVDPKPDVAAGGSGPSLVYIMGPASIGITSLGLAWTVIKKKWMNR